MRRGELRRIARGNSATAWQAREWLDRMPRRTLTGVLEDLAGELAAGADDAYAAGVARGTAYAWQGIRPAAGSGPAYLAGYVWELVSRAVRRRLSRGVPMMLAAILAGALIGAWLSPGRAYAGPVDTGAAAGKTWPACRFEDGSGQRRCVWDGRHMGNGEGYSLKIRRGGTDSAKYVRISHKRAHALAYGGAS